ncbi:MAG TPA: serine hydrolase [Longimicrobium sp.]|jgi:CubicO group peptidase (beta-lactamase class C family)
MSRRALLFLLALVLVLVALRQPYVWRMVTLRRPDVEDYRAMPTRPIAPAPRPAPFTAAPDPAWVTRVPFDAAGGRITSQAELDAFLGAQGTTAFIVVHDGKLIDERYYQGYGRDSLFKAFSMSKSVLSALIGIAQGEGVLRISDTLGAHLDLAGNRALAGVTLEQLADNVGGLRYRRGDAPWKEQPRMYYTADARGYVAGARVVRAPGTTFEPDELSPLLLAHALERALRRRHPGITLSGYAEQRLWQPMGARYGALWTLDRTGDGLEKTESGLVARAVDLARFGQLYLDGGAAGGRQVVPREWVEASTTPPAGGAPNRFDDGFHRRLWWGRERPGQQRFDFYANGHFGQRIYVSPDKRLVLVRMGSASGTVNWTAVLSRIAQGWPAARQGRAAAGPAPVPDLRSQQVPDPPQSTRSRP